MLTATQIVDEAVEKIKARVGEVYTAAHEKGYDLGRAEGFADAADQAAEERAGLREAAFDSFVEVADGAHRDARHSGPWDLCPDPICAAIERWVHFESRENTNG